MYAPIFTDISNNIIRQAYNELNNAIKWCSYLMMFSDSGNTLWSGYVDGRPTAAATAKVIAFGLRRATGPQSKRQLPFRLVSPLLPTSHDPGFIAIAHIGQRTKIRPFPSSVLHG